MVREGHRIGQFHDPAKVAIRIMREAIARDVSADALLDHLDSLNLSDCLNPAGVRQYGVHETFKIFQFNKEFVGKTDELRILL